LLVDSDENLCGDVQRHSDQFRRELDKRHYFLPVRGALDRLQNDIAARDERSDAAGWRVGQNDDALLGNTARST
jgi:hypothetical protein